MVSKEVVSQACEGLKKGRRRRRRAGSRRARKPELVINMAAISGLPAAKCAVHAFLLRYQSALRKVPSHLPPRVHAGPPSKRVKRVSWRDEECGGGGGGGDPAVLAVGPARKALVYSREELLRLRNSPLCKQALDAALRGSDAMALVLKKRPDSPNDEDRGARGDAPNENHKGVFTRERRSADPRERVRKESEPSAGGIVLSPQRRSFVSGCGAPAAAAAPPPALGRTRPESPLSPAAAAQLHPKVDNAGRRIGSGRIMMRDVTSAPWERGSNQQADERDREGEREREPYRPPPVHKQNDRFERRSFGRDSYSSDIKREREERFNNDKPQHRDENRRGRFNQRRFDKDEEPEWFSAGPTSKLDTIELRGFEEPTKQRNGNANNKETDKWKGGDSGTRSPAASPPPSAHSDDAQDTSNDKDSGVESKPGEEPPQSAEQPDFNIDDFLKFDMEADVLTNGGADAEGGSRFSRWFRRESPTHENNRHYERLLHNMVDELSSSGSHVFAPISPAPAAVAARAPSLLDLLRRANQDDRPGEMNANVSAGKIHSLEELEARLRPQPPQPQPQPHPDHDLTAFKRLLAQVSGGHAVPAAAETPRVPPPPQPQPMSLLQMLNKSMEQQQQKPQQPHIPQELLYKLLQVQQRQHPPPEMPAAAAAAAAGLHAPPLPDRELLQRPEAQAIIHGLKAGEITVGHLVQQLNNPGLQSRHRELLLTILRMHHHHTQQLSGGSPLPAPAPHLVLPPHHQPLRLSPVPAAGIPSRIPSPRELAAHTQSIMQSALIKKKLEEQRENYRRRHEMAPPKQPTPISFTPTSVLRKMTAEKESDAPSPKQQWSQPPKMPQGRPIVKGNQGGAPNMGYTPSPADYQQHYMNQQQQQMANAIRPFPHQQQRQMPQSLNSMSGLARGVAGGATLQQLLMHSHQRTLNGGDWPMDMSGGGGPAGGDNQLARWFSPELLARASAGKLPSLRVPNALSLEDLERHHSPAVRN